MGVNSSRGGQNTKPTDAPSGRPTQISSGTNEFYRRIGSGIAFGTSTPGNQRAEDVGQLLCRLEVDNNKTRYLTFVSTDKPLYQPGERVYIRAFVLDAFDHSPPLAFISKIKDAGKVFLHLRVSNASRSEVIASTELDTDSIMTTNNNDNKSIAPVLRGLVLGSSEPDLSHVVLGFRWSIPSTLPGGEYTLSLSYSLRDLEGCHFLAGERTIEVRAALAPPRFIMSLTYTSKGYAPGDTVSAILHAEIAEGGFPKGAAVKPTANITVCASSAVSAGTSDGEENNNDNKTQSIILELDGKLPSGEKYIIDDFGDCAIQFVLPTIGRTQQMEGTLTCIIDDGGVVESVSKTVPIVIRKLTVHVYPEGGALVAGLPSRFYIEALLPWGDPADLEADIVYISKLRKTSPASSGEVVTKEANDKKEGDKGKEKEREDDDNTNEASKLEGQAEGDEFVVVGKVATVHEGRGRGCFTPDKGNQYYLRITRPQGITDLIPFPEIKEQGVVITPVADVYPAEGNITLQLEATSPSVYHVCLYKREKEVGSVVVDFTINFAAEETEQQQHSTTTYKALVCLSGPSSMDGVLRVTVYDELAGDVPLPVAERLVFRKPRKGLRVSLETNKTTYQPGDRVRLNIKTEDYRHKSLPAVVGITVTDESVIGMIEKRKQPPRLPAMVLLETEVDHLEDADVYLSDAPDADSCLDLLLGTQGWRSFVYATNSNDSSSCNGFLKRYGSKAERLLAVSPTIQIQRSPPHVPVPHLPELPPIHNRDQSNWAIKYVCIYKDQQMLLGSAPNSSKYAQIVGLVQGRMGSDPDYKRSFTHDSMGDNLLHIWARGGIVIFCIADSKSAPARVAYSMLDELHTRWHATFDGRNNGPYSAQVLENFRDNVVLRLMSHYSNYEETDKIRRIQAEIDEVKSVMMSNIERVLERGERLDELVERSEELQEQSKLFAAHAARIRSQSPWNRIRNAIPNAMASFTSPTTTASTSMSSSPSPSSSSSDDASSSSSFSSSSDSQASSSSSRPRHAGSHVEVVQTAEGDAALTYERVYAHKRAKPFSMFNNGNNAPRNDFTHTVYWAAAITTNDKGQTTVEFDLSDSITSFRITAEGMAWPHPGRSTGAALCLAESTFSCGTDVKLLQPYVPHVLRCGDEALLPVTISNESDASLSKPVVSITHDGAILAFGDNKMDPKAQIEYPNIHAGKKNRQRLPLYAIGTGQDCKVTLAMKAGSHSDSLAFTCNVIPSGFPFSTSASAMLTPEKGLKHKFCLTGENVHDVIERITLSPNTMSNITGALSALSREPHGCFEQAASTVYPLVAAMQYLKQQVDKDEQAMTLERTMRQQLQRGYQKLLSYEIHGGGFEWWGNAPAHEALTAYGLLLFSEIAQVYPVDKALLKRTRDWLLSKKDGKGGFMNNVGKYAFYTTKKVTSDAYILWTLVETDPKNSEQELSSELACAYNNCEATHNTYVLSLVTMALHGAGRQDPAMSLARRLVEFQNDVGVVQGDDCSIVGTSGDALPIETTALACLAWMKFGSTFSANIGKGMSFIFSKCSFGRYGNTQATAMALRAITRHHEWKTQIIGCANTTLSLHLDGNPILEHATWGSLGADPAKHLDALELPTTFVDRLVPGQEHELELTMTGGEGTQIACAFHLSYRSNTPPSSSDCQVDMTTSLSNDKVREGDLVEIPLTITNKRDTPLPMVVALIGFPAGIEPRHEKLKEQVKAGVFDSYELSPFGNEVVLYWNQMTPSQQVSCRLQFTAKTAGRFTGAAPRCYLYYCDEVKQWNQPLSVMVLPTAEHT